MRRYAKGEERREKLISAVARMLQRCEVTEISMHQVAEAVGNLAGSAYHFFANPTELLAAMTERFGDRIRRRIFADYAEEERPDWSTLFLTASSSQDDSRE